MAKSSAFYYMTVDRDDIFFTKELLKLRFDQRIYLMFREVGYEYIYFLEKVNAAGTLIDVYSTREEAAIEYRKHEKKNILLGDKKIELVDSKAMYVLHSKKEAVKNAIQNLIASRDYDKYLFVMPVDIFSNFYASEFERNQLINFLKYDRHVNGSSFLIVGEPDKEQCPDMPDLEKIRWDFYEERQMIRLLERVNIASSIYEDASIMKRMQQYLYDCFESVQNGRYELLGEKITNKMDIYELLIRNRNMERLKDLV